MTRPSREQSTEAGQLHSHHERLDGKGYPRGLMGDAIAPETRIVSVADVFDALTADRPYRAAMPLDKALGIMRAEVGTAFDPPVSQRWSGRWPQSKEISLAQLKLRRETPEAAST